ncbi:MAG: hypothetical protein ABFE07_29585 [Armatimonadia bacterium]
MALNPRHIDDNPFFDRDGAVSAKAVYLTTLCSEHRIKAISYYLLNGAELYVCAFFGGLRGKVWKVATIAYPIHGVLYNKSWNFLQLDNALTAHAALCQQIIAVAMEALDLTDSGDVDTRVHAMLR